MSATPTPRTDALDNEMILLGSPEGSTPLAETAKHARTLDRELAVEGFSRCLTSMKKPSLPTNFITLPVSSLVEAAWNYKVQNTFVQAKLVENIRRNGQLETIIVRELAPNSYEVVNGNHRLAAFKTLGVDFVVVCNVGTISDAAARRMAVETNETRFERDDLQFAARLTEIMQEFPIDQLLQTMPYTEDEMISALSVQTFDWAESERVSKAKKKSDFKCSLTDEQLAQVELARQVTGATEDSVLLLQAVTALLAINHKA